MGRRPKRREPGGRSWRALRRDASDRPDKLLAAVLGNRVALGDLPQDVAVRLACSGGLDTLIDSARDAAAAAQTRRRYEALFQHVVCGLLEDRLDGRIALLPSGTWSGQQGIANGAIAVRFVIEERLGWAEHEIVSRLDGATLRRAGLNGMLSNGYFRGSPWLALDAAYPGRFRPWELQHAPTWYWQGEAGHRHGIEATRWLFEEKLRWDANAIRRRCRVATFYDNGLGGMLATRFRTSVWRAIEAAYPGRFRPWEFKQSKFWQGPDGRAHAVAATRWLIEEKLHWSDDEVRTRPLYRMFVRHGFGGMMQSRYRGSVWKAIEETYPGRFKRWELRLARGYWNGRPGRARAIEAVRWLIEEKLGWGEPQVRALLRHRTFVDHGFEGMLTTAFGGELEAALAAAYRGRYTERNTLGLRARSIDPLTRTLVTRLAALEEAGRLGPGKVSRRYRITPQSLSLWRRKYDAEGLRGLAPGTRGRGGGPILPLAARRAADAIGWERIDADAATASRLLGKRGWRVSPADVTSVWEATGLAGVKRRVGLLAQVRNHPTVAAAARALGVPEPTLLAWRRRHARSGPGVLRSTDRDVRPDVEWTLLEAATAHPGESGLRLSQRLRAQGICLAPVTITKILTRHRLRTPVRRMLAGEGVPEDLAWLEEVVPRRRTSSRTAPATG